MHGLHIYLASASPRRRELLRQIGIDPVLVPSRVDERPAAAESPRRLVQRLAEAKGRDAAGRLASRAPGVVVAADTVVTIDGVCLGKPSGPAESALMLRQLRGRTHQVLTGVFVARTSGGPCLTDVDVTRVTFRRYDDVMIRSYVATGEGSDKAGAYAIQGKGVLLVRRISGSWSNVVGLPLERMRSWLAEIGIELWDLIPAPPAPR